VVFLRRARREGAKEISLVLTPHDSTDRERAATQGPLRVRDTTRALTAASPFPVARFTKSASRRARGARRVSSSARAREPRRRRRTASPRFDRRSPNGRTSRRSPSRARARVVWRTARAKPETSC
jgi:hypothetical protein